jgi:streptogramin lyase
VVSRTVWWRLRLSVVVAISAQFLTVAVASATAGTLTEFPLPLNDSFCSCPLNIASGPDGNLWFTEPGGGFGNGAIGKITTAGFITEYTLPNANSGPEDIAAGPSGSGLVHRARW